MMERQTPTQEQTPRVRRSPSAFGRWILVALASSVLGAAAGEETQPKAPPFAEGPKKATVAPRPSERSWAVKNGEFAFIVRMKPGIPNVGEVTEVVITANAIPKTPHPRYGSRVPLENARLVVELSNATNQIVGRYLTHAVPLSSGQYGAHVTPGQDGVHTIAIVGATPDGKTLNASVSLPVNVWPLPKELEGSGDESAQGTRRPIKQ